MTAGRPEEANPGRAGDGGIDALAQRPTDEVLHAVPAPDGGSGSSEAELSGKKSVLVFFRPGNVQEYSVFFEQRRNRRANF